MKCDCVHNTTGPNCDICLPFYNDRPWARATETDGMECLRKYHITYIFSVSPIFVPDIQNLNEMLCLYTPGSHAEVYKVFVFPFVCLFIRLILSVTFVEFT